MRVKDVGSGEVFFMAASGMSDCSVCGRKRSAGLEFFEQAIRVRSCKSAEEWLFWREERGKAKERRE